MFYIVGGRRSYKFVKHSLLGSGLPSLKTVQRHIVTRSVSPLTEFGLQLSRLEALPALLQRLGYGLSAVSLAFDAVAILPSLHYRHTDGAVLGFAIDDDKLPSTLLAPPRTWPELSELLATYPLATQAEVWLVCPLDPKLPAVAVCVFTQTSSPSAPGVYRRMDVITEQLDAHGLHVINVGSDGAASQLKAMKMRSGYIDDPCVRQRRGEFCVFGVVDFSGERALRIPARDIRGTLYPDFSVQDPVHVLAKLNAHLQRKVLFFGDSIISIGIFEEIFADPVRAAAFEARTSLRRSDVRIKDKQNFHAAQRIFSLNVITELQCILPPSPRRNALLFYLRLGNCFLSAFLDPKRHVTQRIFDVFYTRFVLLAWQEDLKNRKVNLREGFLSSNVIDCILLDSDMLLAYTMWLLDYDHLRKTVPYAPWRLGSQDCENLFRDNRLSSLQREPRGAEHPQSPPRHGRPQRPFEYVQALRQLRLCTRQSASIR